MIDPRYGIAAGNQALYTIGADGTTLVPSFIDGTGVSLDADGMPENAMFYLDIRNGKAYFRGDVYAENGYFRGTVYATDGEFKGIVKATDFQTKDGTSMLTKDGKFDSKYLDLGGIVIDGETGNINFTGAGSITWGNNAPVKYQFGVAATGPWHDTMQANDKYRRDSLDGGTTWGEPYQFKGTDGKNGSDARVPEYIKQTYIDSVEIHSPTIKANDYYIYPYDETDVDGSFNIYGMYGSRQWHMFQLSYFGGGDTPVVRMCSPASGELHLGKRDAGALPLFIDGVLDLNGVTEIRWGKNAPTAVFG